MAVIDRVVQREDDTVTASTRADRLHRGEDRIRREPVEEASREGLTPRGRRVDCERLRTVRQQRDLPGACTRKVTSDPASAAAADTAAASSAE